MSKAEKQYKGLTSISCNGCIHLISHEIKADGKIIWINQFCQKNCQGFPERYEAGEILRSDGRRGMW